MTHHAALRARIHQSEIRHPQQTSRNSQATWAKVAPILLLLTALCLIRAGSAVVAEPTYNGDLSGKDAPLIGD